MKKIDKIIEEEAQKAVRQTLWESSLSRIRQHMKEHDSGFITAFRGSIIQDDGTTVKPTHKQNLFRNQQLDSLIGRKYDFSKVRGKYIENYDTPEAIEVGEDTFFVVDSEDEGTLEADLKMWGEKFQQDSVLFVPRGAEEGIIWGTNKMNPTAWPGYNNSKKLGYPVFGKSGQIMTKVRGRPFVFTEGKNGGLVEEGKRNYYQNWISEIGRHRCLIDADWRTIK